MTEANDIPTLPAMDPKGIFNAAIRCFEILEKVSFKGEDAERITEVKRLLQGITNETQKPLFIPEVKKSAVA